MNIKLCVRVSFFCLIFSSMLQIASLKAESSFTNIPNNSLNGLTSSINRIKNISLNVKQNTDTIARLNNRLQRVDGQTSLPGAQGYAGNTLVNQINTTTNTANAAYDLANRAQNAANNAQNTANGARNIANNAQNTANNASNQRYHATYVCDPRRYGARTADGWGDTGMYLGYRNYVGIRYTYQFDDIVNLTNDILTGTEISMKTRLAGQIGMTGGFYDDYRDHDGDRDDSWRWASKTHVNCKLVSYYRI